jgi:hypothetical protein
VGADFLRRIRRPSREARADQGDRGVGFRLRTPDFRLQAGSPETGAQSPTTAPAKDPHSSPIRP